MNTRLTSLVLLACAGGSVLVTPARATDRDLAEAEVAYQRAQTTRMVEAALSQAVGRPQIVVGARAISRGTGAMICGIRVSPGEPIRKAKFFILNFGNGKASGQFNVPAETLTANGCYEDGLVLGRGMN